MQQRVCVKSFEIVEYFQFHALSLKNLNAYGNYKFDAAFRYPRFDMGEKAVCQSFYGECARCILSITYPVDRYISVIATFTCSTYGAWPNQYWIALLEACASRPHQPLLLAGAPDRSPYLRRISPISSLTHQMWPGRRRKPNWRMADWW